MATDQLQNIRPDVLAFVQGDVEDSELLTLTTRCINDAVDRINSRQWKKFAKVAAITTAEQIDYESGDGFPSDFKDPIVLLQINASSKRDGRLYFRDMQTFHAEHIDTTAADDPKVYTIIHSTPKLRVNVTPTAAYVAAYPTWNLWYFPRFSRLSGDTDTLAMPNEFERFIVYFAAARLAAVRGHPSLGFCDKHADIAWAELRTDDNEVLGDWNQT